jgi:acetyl esterase/lipase
MFPFPAALLDALASYLYLIKLGFSEENIILVGDSAGANLALALTRYLISNKKQQPKLPKVPGSLVLLSPWTDMSEQFNENPGPQSSQTLNTERDWLSPINIPLSVRVFLGGRPEHVELAYRNPYISPASPVLLGLTPDSPTRAISFKGFPRTFVDNGTFDIFYDQIRRLRDAMVEDLGEEVIMYNEVDGAIHDYLTIDWHNPDRTTTSKKILKWLGE